MVDRLTPDPLTECIAQLIHVALGHRCCYGEKQELRNLEHIFETMKGVHEKLSMEDLRDIKQWSARYE